MLRVGPDGLIAVAALAGDEDPTIAAMGGYLWLSHDGGDSFVLARGSNLPQEARTVIGDETPCASCDTDLLFHDGALHLATFYATVIPFWDVSIVTTTDGGSSWEVRNTGAAVHTPIDRPWLAASEGTPISLIYRYIGPPQEAPADQVRTVGSIYHQSSTDGGRTWSPPSQIKQGQPGVGWTFNKPLVTDEGRILLPIGKSTEASGYEERQNLLMSSDDDGASWTEVPLSESYRWYAAFQFSIEEGPANHLTAAWVQPDARDGTQSLQIRTSDDGGSTWAPPTHVDLPGTVMQPWVSVRDDGLAAVAYYGTEAEGPVLEIPNGTAWNPRVALFDIARPEEPLALVNLTEDPTFTGIYCNRSPACPEEAYWRTPMAEFLSADWGPTGDLFVSYVDATVPFEATVPEGQLKVSRLEIGPAGTS